MFSLSLHDVVPMPFSGMPQSFVLAWPTPFVVVHNFRKRMALHVFLCVQLVHASLVFEIRFRFLPHDPRVVAHVSAHSVSVCSHSS